MGGIDGGHNNINDAGEFDAANFAVALGCEIDDPSPVTNISDEALSGHIRAVYAGALSEAEVNARVRSIRSLFPDTEA